MDIVDVHDKNLNPWDDKAGWRVNGPGFFEIDLLSNGEIKSLLVSIEKKHFQILRPFKTKMLMPAIRWVSQNYGSLLRSAETKNKSINFYVDLEHITFFLKKRTLSFVSPRKAATSKTDALDETNFTAPMPAKVISVNVHAGTEVTAGTILVILEAMKIENPIRATKSGVVETVFFAEGDIVEEGEILLKFTPAEIN